jgi:secretion/DNA translocation related TadE-like protein
MVLVMIVAGLLVTAALGLSSAIIARHRAEAVADLAALAAAATGPDPQACGIARRVAVANAGRLTGCRFAADGSVTVDVQLAAGSRLGLARASARAAQSPGP